MSKDMMAAKDLFHEALEALSLHVGGKTVMINGYELKHIDNALVVWKGDAWASIRTAVTSLEFTRILMEVDYYIVKTELGLQRTLAEYLNENSTVMTYKVHGDTEDSFVWAEGDQLYVGTDEGQPRSIVELSPLDFYSLMEQAGVCLLEYPRPKNGYRGEYAIVSK